LGTFRLRRINLRLLIALAIIAILATAAYGFADSNTFSAGAGKAGDGHGAISGYNVTNIHYTLDNTDPSKIASVSFDLGAVANTVRVQLDGTSSPWITNCTAAGTVWTCPTTGETALAALDLRVVAAQ
jgi:hypothetical protein